MWWIKMDWFIMKIGAKSLGRYTEEEEILKKWKILEMPFSG